MPVNLTWLHRYVSLLLRQLPMLWIVLAVSPNLNQWRVLWIVVIVYTLLYLAFSGFELIINRIEDTRNSVRRTPASVVWWAAAGVYVTAAVLSFQLITGLFAASVALIGVAYLGLLICLPVNDFLHIFGKALLFGIISFVALYLGINDLPIENTFRVNVLAPAFAITLFQLSFSIIGLGNRFYVGGWSILVIAFILITTSFQFNNSSAYLHEGSILLSVTTLTLIILSPGNNRSFHHLASSTAFQRIVLLLLNGYFFYLFAQHTQILQLIQT